MRGMANPRTPVLGEAERAVYDMVRAGLLLLAHRPFYTSAIAALETAGLIAEDVHTGKFRDVCGVAAPPAPPKQAPLSNVVIRMTADEIAALDNAARDQDASRTDVVLAALVQLRIIPPRAKRRRGRAPRGPDGGEPAPAPHGHRRSAPPPSGASGMRPAIKMPDSLPAMPGKTRRGR